MTDLHATPARLVAALPDAMRQGELRPAFQPLVELRTGRVIGFEVLARWRSPMFGEVPPAAFIPLASDAGVLSLLSLRLIRDACKIAGQWPGEFYLAFNLAPQQFLQANLCAELRAAVEGTGIPFDRIQIEITENSLFDDSEVARDSILALKALGASLSLDDFGTGYSSLTRLQSLPFDEIKIDRSFVRDLETQSGSLKIVTAVLGLGHSLGIHVIAEGIETEAQATLLDRLGCRYGQGYLFARPMEAADVPAFLASAKIGTVREQPLDASPFQRLHQLESLYTAAPVALCFLDPGLRVVSANPKVAAYLHLDRTVETLIGRPVGEFLTGSTASALIGSLRQALAGEDVPPSEYRNPETGASYLLAHQRVCDPAGGLVGISVVGIDITGRVRAEQALQETIDHFNRSTELGPHISWAARPDGVVDYISPSLEWAPLGSAEERHARWLERMDPADRLRVRAEWLAHLGSKEIFQTEFRIQWTDDSWRWVRSQAHPHLDANGSVRRWYGIIADISRERELEQRVAGLEGRLLERAGAVASVQGSR